MNSTTDLELLEMTQTRQAYSLPTLVESQPWHVMGMSDLAGHLDQIIATARWLKAQKAAGALPQLLKGKAVALIFEKASTRTRVSFDVGIQLLGGVVSMIDAQGSQLGRGESHEDTAGCLSGYVDAIVYRAKDHESANAIAQHSKVPVINALTDVEHPCQVLADLVTLAEHFDAIGDPGLAGKSLAYVGDGNNMCHSYLIGAALAGMNVDVATPAAYAPHPDVVAVAQLVAAGSGTRVLLTNEPASAAVNADAIATDTWVSMGDETEKEARLAAFAGFTVDDELMDLAHPDAVFLHCLPGYWGYEATHELAHGPRSRIFPQAENRMWAQMALLVHLLGVAPALTENVGW